MEIFIPAILLLLSGFLMGAGLASKRSYIRGFIDATVRARYELDAFLKFLEPGDRLHTKNKLREFEVAHSKKIEASTSNISRIDGKDKQS